MLQFVIILKALVEVALFAFLGQGILYFFAGAKREQNFVYTTFKMLTSPVTKFARLIAPRFVVDQHIAFLALFLLLVAWVALTVAKISLVIAP
ncbi:MAG: hypothetical protein ABI790_02030 [Betaproteobacteria bacterium]